MLNIISVKIRREKRKKINFHFGLEIILLLISFSKLIISINHWLRKKVRPHFVIFYFILNFNVHQIVTQRTFLPEFFPTDTINHQLNENKYDS